MQTNSQLIALYIHSPIHYYLSYFGPAYAKATKIQRAIQLSDNLLVIENQTQLADIPFADRFIVVERWIIEAVKNEKSHSSHNISEEPHPEDTTTMYTSKLTVDAEVIMLKSCSWETQIRTKASETFTDLVTDWCKTATKALKATEEQKRMRLGLVSHGNGKDGMEKKSNNHRAVSKPAAQDTPSIATPPTTDKGSELIARHRRNFQELDKLIAKGDLEWCSIEVMHSSKAGRHSAYAQVLESPMNTMMSGLVKSSTEETDGTDGTEGSMSKVVVVPMMVKRRSRQFMRLLSSRKNKSGI